VHLERPHGCEATPIERLFPTPGPTSPEELASHLRLGEHAPPERPYLVLNMVSSVDGKATLEGETRGLSSDVDRVLFHRLRTQGDAVMVGAHTVALERYGRIVKDPELRAAREREGLAPDPLAVIVSARLTVPADVPILQEPEQEVVIATAAEHELEGVRGRVEYWRTGDDLPLLLGRLRDERGVRSVLCEGGPTLNSHLLAAGLVDELWLSVSPQLIGGVGDPSIVGGRQLPSPRPVELLSLARERDELYTRWRVH
jgi:riboflavin-specific deaminase-like protein